jgi:hypothetical protein
MFMHTVIFCGSGYLREGDQNRGVRAADEWPASSLADMQQPLSLTGCASPVRSGLTLATVDPQPVNGSDEERRGDYILASPLLAWAEDGQRT